MNPNDIQQLFDSLRRRPFPSLGRVVGNFGLYDALLAGTASSYLAGLPLTPETVPEPDPETQGTLNMLANKAALNAEEREFLEYAELLEQLRQEILKGLAHRHSQDKRPEPRTRAPKEGPRRE